MPAWLYDAGSYGLLIFLVTTIGLGGAAALVSGRAIAQTWRPFWQIPLYMLLLASIVRFIQFSVFQGVLFSGRNYLVDFVMLLAISATGYGLTRRGQMASQYDWLEPPPRG